MGVLEDNDELGIKKKPGKTVAFFCTLIINANEELKQFHLIRFIEPDSVFDITPKGFNINNRGCNPRRG